MHGIHDRSVAYSLAVAAGRLHLAGFAMALHWIIDTKRRLIVATAEEEITAGEVRDYLAMVTGAGVSNYRQLFDFSRASANFSARETLELGVLIQAHQKRPSSSALAVVTPDRPAEAVARLLGIMATVQRPMRLFGKLEAALKWLGEPVVRRQDKDAA